MEGGTIKCYLIKKILIGIKKPVVHSCSELDDDMLKLKPKFCLLSKKKIKIK